MTNKYLLSIFITSFLFLGLNIYGQGYTYSGLVIDEQTKEALAFVNLISADAKYGTTTDIDGKFSISLPYRIDSIHFSYLGYNKMTVATNKLKLRSTIKLHPIQYDLAEYEVFPGVNPAHRIILNTIHNIDYIL